jgi:hypothetical protein
MFSAGNARSGSHPIWSFRRSEEGEVMDREKAAAGPKPERIEPEPEPEPQRIEPEPEPGARSRWIKPISSYERRETTVVEGLRYG